MDVKMTRADLAAKVSWEGGIIATLEYGIGAEDLADPVLAQAWGVLEAHWEKVRSHVDAVDLLLQHPRVVPLGPGHHLSTARLAQKVEWEGGIIDALRYGITAADIADPAVAAAWGAMREDYEAMAPAVRAMSRLLDLPS